MNERIDKDWEARFKLNSRQGKLVQKLISEWDGWKSYPEYASFL